MKKGIAFLSLAMIMATPAFSESLLRNRVDNLMNSTQTFFGDDSSEHEVRSLQDRVSLLDEEQRQMLTLLEGKRQEREELAGRLLQMGEETPPPVLLNSIDVTGMSDNSTCLTTYRGVTIHCW